MTRMIPAFKAWFNAASGEQRILNPYGETHQAVLRELGEFEDANEAIEAGWVRLGTHKDPTWRIPESFVSGNTQKDVRVGLKWLLKNDPEPGLSVVIETNDGIAWQKLDGKEIDRFVRTGGLPTRPLHLVQRP